MAPSFQWGKQVQNVELAALGSESVSGRAAIPTLQTGRSFCLQKQVLSGVSCYLFQEVPSSPPAGPFQHAPPKHLAWACDVGRHWA